MVDYYKSLLLDSSCDFLNDYLNDPLLQRLKKVGYFCGMDYASKDIYNFSEYISRYDHSLTVALLVYKLTKDRTMSIAGLYHDIATPCFSHVIDYMNKDYQNQESTEKLTRKILLEDKYLQQLLTRDDITLDDIINFKQYSIVDNKRPLVCADRVDGVVLNQIGWIKNITLEDINKIVNGLTVYKNEYNEDEIGFNSFEVAKKFQDLNDEINREMHSKEDIYMMELLANITKYAIDNDYLSYNDLFIMTEEELFEYLERTNDNHIIESLNIFKTIKKDDIPSNYYIDVKNRNINPLVKQKRLVL